MWRWCLDIVFPRFCVGCGQMGGYLCPGCYEQVDFFTSPIKLDLTPCYLQQTIAACHYTFPITTLVHTFKYQSVKGIGRWLAEMIYETTVIPPVKAVTAVPLHPYKLDERGFNQTEVLARHLAVLLNRPYLPLLSKTQHTVAQASLKERTQRIKHNENLFRYHPQPEPTQTLTDILLVDDVTTTGTTLNQCAQVLKQAGWKTVYGLVVAHGQS